MELARYKTASPVPQPSLPASGDSCKWVFKRILKEQWSLALASGLKFVEVQRYRGHSKNQLKFSDLGKVVIFAASGHSHATVDERSCFTD